MKKLLCLMLAITVFFSLIVFSPASLAAEELAPGGFRNTGRVYSLPQAFRDSEIDVLYAQCLAE